jgi:hypothetical protein
VCPPGAYARGPARVESPESAESVANAIFWDFNYMIADERRGLRTLADERILMVRYRATVAREFLGMGRFDLFETTGAPLLAGIGEGPP